MKIQRLLVALTVANIALLAFLSDPTYVSMRARGTSTSVKLTDKDGRQQLIRP